MAAFPSLKFAWRDLQETPQSVIERAEMERGVPKQRRIASDVRCEVAYTVHFDTKAEAAAFEAWFYGEIAAGQAWFDWTHPRLGTAHQARIVGGEIGALKFLNPTLEASTRSFKVEYWRSAW